MKKVMATISQINTALNLKITRAVTDHICFLFTGKNTEYYSLENKKARPMVELFCG